MVLEKGLYLLQEKEEANHVTDEPLKDEELNDSIPTQQNHEGESSDQTVSDDVKEEEEEPVNSVDNNISRADEETPDYIVSINADYEEDEQVRPILCCFGFKDIIYI